MVQGPEVLQHSNPQSWRRLGPSNHFLVFLPQRPAYHAAMPQPPDPPADDPLGLEGVDREIRVEKLRREIEEAAGGEMFSGKTADCDPGVEEAFLENVLALESHGFAAMYGGPESHRQEDPLARP